MNNKCIKYCCMFVYVLWLYIVLFALDILPFRRALCSILQLYLFSTLTLVSFAQSSATKIECIVTVILYCKVWVLVYGFSVMNQYNTIKFY